MEKYYMIGEISNITNIPIRTLHYYDEINLIKPFRKDANNNYRIYSYEQIPILLAIKQYKIAGFSLNEIKKLLKRENIDYVNKIFEKQYNILEDKIREIEISKKRLKILIENNSIKEGISIKKINEMYVAYVRYRCPCKKEFIYKKYAELIEVIEKEKLHMIGNMMAIYYETYENPNYENMDFEVCVPVNEKREILGKVKKIAGFTAISAIHIGKYETIPNTCIKMFEWMNENKYIPFGEYIESYLMDMTNTINEDDFKTELIRPIKKA